jgi:hypothetical protein
VISFVISLLLAWRLWLAEASALSGGAGGSARALFFDLPGRRLWGRGKRLALLQRRNFCLRFLMCTGRWVVGYFDEFADCEAHGSAAA